VSVQEQELGALTMQVGVDVVLLRDTGFASLSKSHIVAPAEEWRKSDAVTGAGAIHMSVETIKKRLPASVGRCFACCANPDASSVDGALVRQGTS
jgi:hypothetical protein